MLLKGEGNFHRKILRHPFMICLCVSVLRIRTGVPLTGDLQVDTTRNSSTSSQTLVVQFTFLYYFMLWKARAAAGVASSPDLQYKYASAAGRTS
jgi:hypothetical protein